MNEAANLTNWAFNQTTQKILLEKNQFITEVDVWLGNKPRLKLLSSKKVISTLSFDQIQLMSSKIEYTKPIEAPINKGEEYGNIVIKIDGKPTLNIPLIAEENIGKINPLFKIFAVIKYLIFGTSLDES